MSLADIEKLLRERAVNTHGDVRYAWDLQRNDVVTRVRAATREVFATSGTACQAADELAASILALGYQMVHVCEVGALRLDEDAVATQWRGRIDLVLHPAGY